MMEYQEVLRTHAIPGRAISEWVIPASEYCAFNFARGETLRFVDIEGKQVPDLVCFKVGDLQDALNLANSQLLNKHLELVEGDVLYSVSCNPLMKITGYSNSNCFTYGSMCSEPLNRIRYGIANTRNCRDNLRQALSPWNVSGASIPNAFVPFMRTEILEDGTLEIREPSSTPGDYYDLIAETDILVAVSNCPQRLNPVNGFDPTPMGIVIYEEGSH